MFLHLWSCQPVGGWAEAGVAERGGTRSIGAWWEALSHITEQKKKKNHSLCAR